MDFLKIAKVMMIIPIVTLLYYMIPKGQWHAILHVLTHLILRTKLHGRQHHYFHFTDKANEIGKIWVLFWMSQLVQTKPSWQIPRDCALKNYTIQLNIKSDIFYIKQKLFCTTVIKVMWHWQRREGWDWVFYKQVREWIENHVWDSTTKDCRVQWGKNQE